MPDNTVLKQATPFARENFPLYFADHVNYHGTNFESIYVYSAGLDRNWPDRVISAQSNRLILHYVIEGKCYFNDTPVSAGQMLFILPNNPYTITQDKDTPAKAWWLTIKGSNITSFSEYCKFKTNYGVMDCDRIEEISSFIENMVYFPHFGVAPEAVLTANLFNIIAIQKYNNASYSQQTHIQNRYVFEALKYIEDHCMERLTIEDIANHVHVSAKYLSNIFSKYANCSMRDYIQQSKMNMAQNLLKSSRYGVRDISELLGYSDYFQFSRQFKKHFGVSPVKVKRK